MIIIGQMWLIWIVTNGEEMQQILKPVFRAINLTRRARFNNGLIFIQNIVDFIQKMHLCQNFIAESASNVTIYV